MDGKTLSAMFTGVGVGAVTTVLFIAAYVAVVSTVAQTNLLLGDGMDSAQDLLGYYMLPSALVGGASCMLISRWVLPRMLAVILTALATLLVTPMALGTLSHLYYRVDARCCMREQDPAELSMAYINHTPNVVSAVDFDGKGIGLEFAPVRGADKEDVYLAGGLYTRYWMPGKRYNLSWHRYPRGARTATVVAAAVSVPPYLGTRRKVFAIHFLPNDQVRIEVVRIDPSNSKVQTEVPPSDEYVAQGKVIG